MLAQRGDKVKIGLKAVGWEGMERLCLSQERNK
jgi:hypothetical protein